MRPGPEITENIEIIQNHSKKINKMLILLLIPFVLRKLKQEINAVILMNIHNFVLQTYDHSFHSPVLSFEILLHTC